MDIQLAMWREDLNDPFILTKFELFNDPNLKEIEWFLRDQFETIPLQLYLPFKVPYAR